MFLTVFGTCAILVPLGLRIASFEGLEGWAVGGGALLLYYGWQLSETRISARETRRPEDALPDASLPFASVSKITFQVAFLAGGGAPTWGLGGAGLALLLAGIGLRTWAVRALGSEYSHRFRLPGTLVTTGPYGRIRHPAYAGTWIAHLGIPLVFPNPFAAAAFGLLWTPAVLWRTVVEDRLLRGDPRYADYAARTQRLVPFVW